jgi:NADPH:quinone reductase-like Zn-dependent oxidoreductase
MKAVIWTKYGPPEVLKLADIEKPVPKANEVLIKIHATTLFPGDAELRRFEIPVAFLWLPIRIWMGIFKPTRVKVLGQEVAGEIESVGSEVERFKKGDKVCGVTGMNFGGYAQFACLSEEFTAGKGLTALILRNTNYAEAAAIPTGGLNAWHFIKRGNIQPGEKVLINGAGGSIGCFAVQFAKAAGAEVTAVDNSTKLEKLRAIGADHVIDYTQEDFTRNGETYDVIFDVIDKSSYLRSMRSLKEKGRYLLVNTTPLYQFLTLWSYLTSSKKVICEFARVKTDYFDSIRELMESGKVKTIIDRTYPLEEMVDAHRYVETNKKVGNIVISVSHDDAIQ